VESVWIAYDNSLNINFPYLTPGYAEIRHKIYEKVQEFYKKEPFYFCGLLG